MKSVYRLGDDLFVAGAFVTLIIGVVLKLLGIYEIGLGITIRSIFSFSVVCLMFSIALSLYELNSKQK